MCYQVEAPFTNTVPCESTAERVTRSQRWPGVTVAAVVVELTTVHSASAMLERMPSLSDTQMVKRLPAALASDGTCTPTCCQSAISSGLLVYVELFALNASKRV